MIDRVCRNCKWWVCYLIPLDENASYFGNCKSAEVHQGKRLVEETSAYVSIHGHGIPDEETLIGVLQTKPDFGCNQWEEKK